MVDAFLSLYKFQGDQIEFLRKRAQQFDVHTKYTLFKYHNLWDAINEFLDERTKLQRRLSDLSVPENGQPK